MAWQRERIEKREWLRLVVRAWREEKGRSDEEEREEEEQNQADTANCTAIALHTQRNKDNGCGSEASRRQRKARGAPAKEWAPKQAMAVAKYTALVVRTAQKHRHKAQSAAHWYSHRRV